MYFCHSSFQLRQFEGASNPSGSTEVIIENYEFTPAELTATVGTTVTWINKDLVGHTVTEETPESPKPASQRVFDSSGEAQTSRPAVIAPGQSWSYTFNTPGTYDYYCIPHPYMKGRQSCCRQVLVIREAAVPATSL